MRRHLVILKRMQRNIITLRQRYLTSGYRFTHGLFLVSATRSNHIAFKHISNISRICLSRIFIFSTSRNVINSMHVKGLFLLIM